MRALIPVAVTDATLISSSVSETGYAGWAAGTTYALGDRVVRAHRVYESTFGANAGNDPTADAPVGWSEIGPTNRWAMFDQPSGQRTTASSDIVVTLAPAVAIGGVAILDADASSARVQVSANGKSIYDRTITGVLATFTFMDLPVVAGQTIKVTVATASGAAAIGGLIIGTILELGATETGPTIGITDYSRRETDDFGVTTVVERAYAKRASVRLKLDSAAVDAIERSLAAIRATPVVWVGEDGFDALTTYGFYKDFSIALQLQSVSFCELTIEGLPSAAVADIGSDDPAPDTSAGRLMVVRPLTITDAILVASSVLENDYPEWSATTTYAAGVRVMRAATHRVYESVIAGNIGQDPAGSGANNWTEVGPTNRWAVFDQALGTATAATTQIEFTLAPGVPVTAIVVLDTNAATVRVRSAGYDQQKALTVDASGVTSATFLDLATAAGASITVTISAAAAGLPVSAGTLIVGSIAQLGTTEDLPTIAITDYSRKVTDDFGNTTPVQRAWAKRMSARSLVKSGSVDRLMRRIAAIRAVPSLWIGLDGIDSLTIYGFFKDFSVELAQNVSIASLTIEGLSTAAPIAAAAAVAVDWANITSNNPAHSKPADGATVGATIGVDLKLPDGSIAVPSYLLNTSISLKPDGRLVALMDGVEQVLGTLTLPGLGAAAASNARQLDSDMAKLAEAVAQLLAGQQVVQGVLRDAGLYTDPASGIAKLFAVEKSAERITNLAVTLNAAVAQIGLKASVSYVDAAIAQAAIDPSQIVDFGGILVRLTSAETAIDGLNATVTLKADATTVTALQGTVGRVSQTLDALGATISQKASQTQVDAHETRLTNAEVTIQALDGASISQAVTASRNAPLSADAAGALTILGLLSGERTRDEAQTGIAAARTEMFARVDGANSALARFAFDVGVQIGAVSAQAATETTARIADDMALSKTLTAYQAQTGDALARADTAIGAVTTTANATVQALSNYQTDVNGVLASIDHTLTVTSNLAGATATDLANYKTSVGGTLATFSSFVGTQSDFNGAISGRMDRAETTVGTHTATLQTFGQSIDGLGGRWGFEFNVDGRITGAVTNAGADRTDLTFLVDSLRVVRPGSSPRLVFAIGDDGNTYILGKLLANSIDTYMLNGHVVTRREEAESSGDIAGSGGFATAAQVNFNLPFPADVIVSMNGVMSYSGGLPDFGTELLIDGNYTIGGPSGGAGFATTSYSMTRKISMAAGNHSIAHRWRGGDGRVRLLAGASVVIDAAMA